MLLLIAALSAALLGCDDEAYRIYGYAEGRFSLLSTPMSGQIGALHVTDGSAVTAGQPIAALDRTVQDAAVARAKARLVSATASLADAKRGGRAQEIEAAQQRLERAQATAKRAKQDYDRVKPLFTRGVVAKSRLDDALSVLQEAEASVAERIEELSLAQLPAREDRLDALKAEVTAAQATLTAENRLLAQMLLVAPSDGTIERVLRRPGEVAGPGAPIVRFLPADKRIAVLFVAQPQRHHVSVGKQVTVECDGCAAATIATVDRVSGEAEFTSPMIFSDKERARLVYRVEAQFHDAAPPIGTPVWANITAALTP
ncbi:MAG: HlyD family efflux transporter periplasmic adaptor subunit [Pseudomonadota bacterium]